MFSRWRLARTVTFTVGVILTMMAALVAAPSAEAAPDAPQLRAAAKVGGKCTKVGKLAKSGAKTLVCTKVGKKKLWKAKKSAPPVPVAPIAPVTTPIAPAPAPVAPTPDPAPTTPTPDPGPTTPPPDPGPTTPPPDPGPTTPPPDPDPGGPAVSWIWNHDQSQWQAMGTPPTCPTPLIPDGSLIRFKSGEFTDGPVSFVQPGQSRGGSYKPHGGYRWSDWNTYVPGVQVTVPFDGQVVGAWHYLVRTSAPEATGTPDETTTYQFGVNIVNSCGVMIRLGHLNTPSAQFAGILSTLAPAVVDDSRENEITPVAVHAGDVIATSVGIPPPATSDLLGTFIDFGLLDLRAPNPVLAPDFSTNADVKYSKYSVCWYENELVGEGDRAATNSLPFSNGDGTSDYCDRDTEPTS